MDARDYEQFVMLVCAELAANDVARVAKGKVYVGKTTGRPIATDVSFETDVFGSRLLVVIECKHYSQTVPVGDVEEFHSKLDDIGAHKGIMITTKGYQAGCMKVAKGRGIALAVLRPGGHPKDLKYTVETATPCDGTPRGPMLCGHFLTGGQSVSSATAQPLAFESGMDFVRTVRVALFDKFDTRSLVDGPTNRTVDRDHRETWDAK